MSTSLLKSLRRPPWRTIVPGLTLLAALCFAYAVWQPGSDVRDGRDDRRRNGIWLAHGWLGGDDWFVRNDKTNELPKYRVTASIRGLADRLRRDGISDVFPHLCPVEPDGTLPSIDGIQTERFLDAFDGIRVLPWVGGPNGGAALIHRASWRTNFCVALRRMVDEHKRFAGIHLNIEPLQSGDSDYLRLLESIREYLPKDKVISVAAYPPPTRWHPYPDVHWDSDFYREVAVRCDQLVVMMYDVGQRIPKLYQQTMANWTGEVLQWSGKAQVLLGVPTYADAGVPYHNPRVENLTNALMGIHRGLQRANRPSNYQGVAIYCDWETSPDEWAFYREHFAAQEGQGK